MECGLRPSARRLRLTLCSCKRRMPEDVSGGAAGISHSKHLQAHRLDHAFHLHRSRVVSPLQTGRQFPADFLRCLNHLLRVSICTCKGFLAVYVFAVIQRVQRDRAVQRVRSTHMHYVNVLIRAQVFIIRINLRAQFEFLVCLLRFSFSISHSAMISTSSLFTSAGICFVVAITPIPITPTLNVAIIVYLLFSFLYFLFMRELYPSVLYTSLRSLPYPLSAYIRFRNICRILSP